MPCIASKDIPQVSYLTFSLYWSIDCICRVATQDDHLNSSRVSLQVYPLFAEWALQFLFEPKVNAFGVELVGARQCFHHLARLQVLQADGAPVFVIIFILFVTRHLLFFILEAGDGVDDVLDLVWREQWLTIFVNLLRL